MKKEKKKTNKSYIPKIHHVKKTTTLGTKPELPKAVEVEEDFFERAMEQIGQYKKKYSKNMAQEEENIAEKANKAIEDTQQENFRTRSNTI